ncbi:MAG: hypothetical protein NZM35_11915 [Chitinophagales bacterium]|nr:hypothetical protein [Chitinophagales bacterium]
MATLARLCCFAQNKGCWSACPGEGCVGRDHRERCETQWSTGAKRTP